MAGCQAVAQILFFNTVNWHRLKNYSFSFYLLSPSTPKSFVYCKIEKQLLCSGEKKCPNGPFFFPFFSPSYLILNLGSIYDEISRITLLFLNFKRVMSSSDDQRK